MVLSELFLSASLQVLFERLFSRELIASTWRERPLYNLIRKLKLVMLSAHSLFNGAEESHFRDPIVKEWLNELQEASYLAEELLNKISAATLGEEVGGESRLGNQVWENISHSLDRIFRNKEDKLKKLIDSLEFIIQQKDCLDLGGISHYGPSKLPPPTSLVGEEHSSIVGRDAIKEELIRILLEDETNIRRVVISIVGMGGIGKTTITQVVCNDVQVRNFFDFLAWVNVADEFDICRLTKQILGAINIKDNDENDLNQLQLRLNHVVRGKKILLVLDNVWYDNGLFWDSLEKPFQSSAPGSKIIVTSRSERVATLMRSNFTYWLPRLSDEDSRVLFNRYSFIPPDPRLRNASAQIVAKCRGLPLAIVSLGGLLRNQQNLYEWEKVLNSEMWELFGKEHNILPTLWLSYCRLPPYLKKCFAHTSVFPKGHEFEKEQLILLWMAEGLLQPQKGRRMEDIGEEYFNILVSRSMFQRASNRFSVHDLLHDLALYVLGEFCVRLVDNESRVIPLRTRHISYINGNVSAEEAFLKFKEVVLSDNNRMRTFLSFGIPRADASCDELLLTKSARYLRAVSLSDYGIGSLNCSIGNLTCIRYLDLSGNKFEELPDIFCSLYNLQTLLLRNCNKLTRLPKRFSMLINLCCLDISGTSSLKGMPMEISNLNLLQKLSDFVLGDQMEYSGLGDLKALQNLRGSLMIRKLQNAPDYLDANLKDHKYLTELHFNWEVHADNVKEREVFDKLKPHENLKELFIEHYNGTEGFPNWVGDGSFTNLVSLHLIGCRSSPSLPPLGQLSSLEKLEIGGFQRLVTIGEDFYSRGPSVSYPFKKLKVLHFENMPSWKKWYFVANGLSDEIELLSLERLILVDCPKLKDAVIPGWLLRRTSRL